jgi:hypothetical protein
MNKLHSIIAACVCALLLIVLAVPGFASAADPATGSPTVEINLGADNAGAEFYYKTDAGVMPGTLKADSNGVIAIELGGSSRYILTYAGAATGMPSVTEPEETSSADNMEPSETHSAETEATQEATSDNGNKPPVKDMIIFFAGLVLCGGFLLGSKVFSVVKAKKAAKEEDDYQDGYSN